MVVESVLRWVGSSLPRAKRIPPEKWNEHRAELEDMYQIMTLDQLMTVMTTNHDFTASRRQYIHKFQQWGFVKYGKDAAPDSCHPQSGGPRLLTTDLISPTKVEKRTSSLLSAGTSAGITSQSPIRFTKRAKQEEPWSSNLDKTASDSNPSLVAEHLTQERWHGGIASDEPSMQSKRQQTDTVDRPKAACSDNYESQIGSLAVPDCPNAPNTYSSFALTGLSLNNYSHFDSPSTQFITYSETEIIYMKRLADYLRSIELHTEAFELYALLLKRQLSEFPEDSRSFLRLLLNCDFRLCSDHSRFMEDLANIQLRAVESSSLEYFLLHMHLAKTFRLVNDIGKAKHHAALARGALHETDLLAKLPEDDRSFDLLMYHEVIRIINGNGNDLVQNDRMIIPEDKLTEETILCRVPGPFEVQDGVMRNPCIRSCLEWCGKQLISLSSSPHFLRKASLPRESKRILQQHFQLLIGFWQRYDEAASHSNDSWLWMTDSSCRMGISPTELLIIVCKLIYSMTDKRWSITSEDLFFRLNWPLQKCLLLSDGDLALEFLKVFVHSRTIPPSGRARQSAVREIVRGQTESSLNQSLPDGVETERIETTATQPPQGLLQEISADMMPSWAPSLSGAGSTDYDSFRQLRDRIGENVAREAVAAGTLPSAFWYGSMRRRQKRINEIADELRTCLDPSKLGEPGRDHLSSRGLAVA